MAKKKCIGAQKAPCRRMPGFCFYSMTHFVPWCSCQKSALYNANLCILCRHRCAHDLDGQPCMVIILECILKMCAALPGQLFDFKTCPVLRNAGFMCKTKQGESNFKHAAKEIRGSIESGFLLHSCRQEFRSAYRRCQVII